MSVERLRFKDENGNNYQNLNPAKNSNILKERKEYALKTGTLPHVSLTKKGVVDKSERYERDFLVKTEDKKYKVTRIGDLCYNPANLKFGVITLNENLEGVFSPIYVTFDISNNVSKLFAKYFYTRNSYIQKLRKYEEGTVYERMAVKPQDFLKDSIKLPVKEEQEKIGNFLSLFDRLIIKLETKIGLLKELKKGYLQQMFPAKGETVPKIRFSGFDRDWTLKKLDEIVKRSNKNSEDDNLTRIEFEDILSGKGRIKEKTFEKINTKKGIEFNKRDILFGKLRPYLKNWLYADFSGIAVGDFWVLKAKSIESLLAYYLIQTDIFMSYANNTSGSKMPRSDWSFVSSQKFSLPSHNIEQEKIGNFFKGLDSIAEKHEKELDAIEQFKKGYMQRLFA